MSISIRDLENIESIDIYGASDDELHLWAHSCQEVLDNEDPDDYDEEIIRNLYELCEDELAIRGY